MTGRGRSTRLASAEARPPEAAHQLREGGRRASSVGCGGGGGGSPRPWRPPADGGRSRRGSHADGGRSRSRGEDSGGATAGRVPAERHPHEVAPPMAAARVGPPPGPHGCPAGPPPGPRGAGRRHPPVQRGGAGQGGGVHRWRRESSSVIASGTRIFAADRRRASFRGRRFSLRIVVLRRAVNFDATLSANLYI